MMLARMQTCERDGSYLFFLSHLYCTTKYTQQKGCAVHERSGAGRFICCIFPLLEEKLRRGESKKKRGFG